VSFGPSSCESRDLRKALGRWNADGGGGAASLGSFSRSLPLRAPPDTACLMVSWSEERNIFLKDFGGGLMEEVEEEGRWEGVAEVEACG